MNLFSLEPGLRIGAFRIIFFVANAQNSIAALGSTWLALLLLVNVIDRAVSNQHPP